MIDYSSLPLTPEDARAARNYLGLSQAKAADESNLPAHKLKRFEAGNYIPDDEFLADLRAFFEGRGYEFQDTKKPGDKARGAGQVFPAGLVGAPPENQGSPWGSRPQRAQFHHMRIAITDEGEMGRTLDLIDSNEQHIEEILRHKVETGLFGGLTEASQVAHAEVLKLLAENGKLFARLFGREVGGAPKVSILDGLSKPENHADLLHQRQAGALRIVAGDREAQSQRKAQKHATSLMGSLFG
jgi:transcriptional regulator with XRE-family HTH domain